MRIVIGLLAVSAAAACGDDGGGPPVGIGTDGSVLFPDSSLIDSPGAVDAAVDVGVNTGDAISVMGRVCVVNDPRSLNDCAATGGNGFTVELGDGTTTTTNADGTFTILGNGDEWTVMSANTVTSHMLLGDYEIPVITKTTYQAMITNNLQGLTLNPGEGSVMVFVLSNGFGVAGAVADTTPSASWEPFYDSTTPTTFSQDPVTGTGAEGMVWVAGLDVGTASVTVVYGGETVTLGGLPIYDGHITFATAIFPVP